MNTSKTRSSIINAISSLVYIAVNGLLGLLYVRLVLKYFGSDYNGVNSSSTQLVNLLLVLEGGFTLATNVALFSPIRNNDHESINAILSATKRRFWLIGVLFLVFGVAFSFVYALFIKSGLDYWIIIYIFLMSIIPQGLNLIVAIKYKSLLMSDQKEYVISISSMLTVAMGYGVTFLLMIMGWGSFWSIKIGPFIFSIVNSIFIVIFVRYRYKFLKLSVKPDYASIKGTKDVFVSKIAGALYTAIPFIIISTYFDDGSKLVSLYAVYASIYSLLSNAITAFTSAPRFAFGTLFVENDSNKLKDKFLEYEFITFLVTSALLSTAMSLIIPFVSIYTRGVDDYNYVDVAIPIVLSITFFISSIHIPSGHMINMSGNFKLSKKINLISLMFLVIIVTIAMLLTYFLKLNIYVLLISVCLATLLLAILEFFYAHFKVLHISFLDTLRLLLPSLCVFAVSIIIGIVVFNASIITNYLLFAVWGAIFGLGYCLVLIILSRIFNNYQFNWLKDLLFGIIRRKK